MFLSGPKNQFIRKEECSDAEQESRHGRQQESINQQKDSVGGKSR
jgi:hypothetical protein